MWDFLEELIIDPELKELIPPLTKDEYNSLEQSILNEGCRDAIITWHGTIVDGHNRYKICREHNLAFEIREKEFATKEDVKLWMIGNQLARRNINSYARTTLISLSDEIQATRQLAQQTKQNNLKQNKVKIITEDFEHSESEYNTTDTETENNTDFVNSQNRKITANTTAEIAKQANVGQQTASRVIKINKAIDDAVKTETTVAGQKPEELKEKLMTGEVSINEAYNKIKNEQKQQRKEEKAERKSYRLEHEIPDGYCTLYCSDIKTGLTEIPDGSIDYIITDPPYPKEYLPLYSDLSSVASRVLKPGGSLIVMTGQSYLPEVIERLSEHMQYHWCLAYTTPGGQSPQLFTKKVNSFWKPVLWFVNGKYEGEWVGDVLKSPVNDNDKRYHEWGQSLNGIKDIVERFTNPGNTILDPFLGGGTTGVAAVTTNRKFIGADINQSSINISENRIKEVYTECLK